MTALKDRTHAEPEVLIEEARRRQRRRRAWLAGLAGVLAAVGIVVGFTSGGASGSDPLPTGQASGPGPQVTASWKELSAPGGALPAWTQISDVVSYRGKLVATGALNRRVGGLGCPQSCGTVIWVSPTGRRWRPVLKLQQGSPGNALVATRHGLVVLNVGMQSLNGGVSGGRSVSIRQMLAHGTPSWMPAPPSRSEGQVVNSIGEDNDGPPSASHPNSNLEQPVVTSPDGVHWPLSAQNGTYKWRSAVKVQGGFVGITQTANATTVLWSSNDRSWSPAHVSIPRSDVAELASGASGAVLELIPSRFPYRPAPVQFWYSKSGHTWTRATVTGTPPTIRDTHGMMPALIAADGGFLAFDRTNTGIWWSKTGSMWTRVQVANPPSAKLEPQSVSIAGQSLLVAEQGEELMHRNHRSFEFPLGRVTFWRLRLAL